MGGTGKPKGGERGGLVPQQSGSAAFLGQSVSAGDGREAPGTEVKELTAVVFQGAQGSKEYRWALPAP